MRSRSLRQLVATSFLLVGTAAYGQDPGDDLTSLSYISYLERYATLRGAAQGETLDAVVNMPVLPGDRVETSRGARMEIQLADGSTVWLDQFTTLDFDSIANSRGFAATRTALYLAAGTVAVEVGPRAASVLVNSPAGQVFLGRGGLYLLELEGKQLRVAAHRGAAELPAGMGSVLLRAGFAAWVADGEELQRVEWAGDGNDFWRWVLERRLPPTRSAAARYVEGAPKAYILDSYGDWVFVADLGAWGWRPRVTVTWVPYSYGRWYWTPAGWYWISYEPWGWYPYHYGSWYFSVTHGWVWFWDPVWGPAWVHWVYTPGYVGWCPRGYYDWWWWRHREHRHHRPHRWSEVSFDFSGKVRLGHIDHRPWTFVPEDRFTYSHIDRVRVDAERVIRSVGDREAVVRSGPLVGPPPRDQGRYPVFRELFPQTPAKEVTLYLRREAPRSVDAGELPALTRTSETVRRTQPGVRIPGEGDQSRPGFERSPIQRRQPGTAERGVPAGTGWERPELPEDRPAQDELRRPGFTSRKPSSWEISVPRSENPPGQRLQERREVQPPFDRPKPRDQERFRPSQPGNDGQGWPGGGLPRREELRESDRHSIPHRSWEIRAPRSEHPGGQASEDTTPQRSLPELRQTLRRWPPSGETPSGGSAPASPGQPGIPSRSPGLGRETPPEAGPRRGSGGPSTSSPLVRAPSAGSSSRPEAAPRRPAVSAPAPPVRPAPPSHPSPEQRQD